MQQQQHQPDHALAVREAHATSDDDTLRLTRRWGYATQGIRESLLWEAGDERPRAMRKWFTRKRPRKTILLLLGLLSGGAMAMFFLLHLWERTQISVLLL